MDRTTPQATGTTDSPGMVARSAPPPAVRLLPPTVPWPGTSGPAAATPAAAADTPAAAAPPVAAAPSRSAINALTGVRALAALWVVVFHVRFELRELVPGLRVFDPVLNGGFMGVEIFFVLSGFIIAYNYAETMQRPTRGAYGTYLYMRLARIYPVHLVMVLLYICAFVAAARVHVVIAQAANTGPLGVLANLTLLQGLPTPGDRLAWNGASWTITYEWFAYLAFPLLALLVWRLTRRRSLVLVAGAAVVFTLACLAVLAHHGVDISKDHIGGVFRISGEFTAGVAICRLYRLRSTVRQRSLDWLVVASVVAAVVVMYLVRGVQQDSAFAVLPLVVVAVYALACSTGPVARVLSSRIALYGGLVSYSLYMVHPLVMVAMRRAFPPVRFEHHSIVVRLVVAVLYLAVAWIAAAVMYHVVEKPARVAMRRLMHVRGRAVEVRAVESELASS